MKKKTGKLVYFFGKGKADGNAKMKDYLGGKGANLAEMTNIGLPVPPGFTVSAIVCQLYYNGGKKWPAGLSQEIEDNLKKLEKVTGKKFGDHINPLLVSVRSGAAVSMPGMMDTVLNIGLNEDTLSAIASLTDNPRFAWDSYRRFIQMFGDVVMGVPHSSFEDELKRVKAQYGKKQDIELTSEELKEVVHGFKEIYKKFTKEDFPKNPKDQLYKAIDAVLESWNNERALKYREIHDIKNLLGTGVNVQAMVFGNMGESSGTGVCFTRDAGTGKKEIQGEFLINAQGEDVVAGIRTPLPIIELENILPKNYAELVKICDRLEKHYRDMQDLEFTIEQGKLFMLQTRNGKRNGTSAVKIAKEMVEEKLISKKEAIMRINADYIDQLLHPSFAEEDLKKASPLTKGLPASPGAAVGQVVFTAADAVKWAEEGKKVILCRVETSPEDVAGMHKANGILTSVGGMTSHAAVVARGWGKCCVVGADDVNINYAEKSMKIAGKLFTEGDNISIDGSTGYVYEGVIPTRSTEMSDDFKTIMKWADDMRRLKIRTNSDSPQDTRKAVSLGAEGIGLCRTEHMFFAEGRINAFRRLILFAYESKRLEKLIGKAGENEQIELRKQHDFSLTAYNKALDELLPFQKNDFVGIFEALEGRPATIRLLDPPLHEFLPKEIKDMEALASETGLSVDKIRQISEDLHEQNPMLGHRGCRLGLTYPEITKMQVRAIIEAAIEVRKEKGIETLPEIMIPLVGDYRELKLSREIAQKVIEDVFKEKEIKAGYVKYLIGTMIEVPRAALTADEIARYADFFSFGTNDLTQMGAGFSRDDAGKFLGDYVGMGIYEKDPFQTLDKVGIGKMIKIAVSLGRGEKKDLKIGICGEHGGDPASIYFCDEVGMNYVSCSPLRVPIARLAAAQAVEVNSEHKAAPVKKSAKTVKKVSKKVKPKTPVKKTMATSKKKSSVKKTAEKKIKKSPPKKKTVKKAEGKKAKKIVRAKISKKTVKGAKSRKR
ncbi:pyruvate, phosphate dikinase [candidate division WOR-3 bacterium]|nr:pyruvate, phosphate dikinase [candidate division WOR-3 bacterium]